MASITNAQTLATISRLLADPLKNYPDATVAAFDPTTGDLPRRKLDHSLLQKMLGQYGQLQIPAVLLAASTGAGHLRTPTELSEWFAAAQKADVGAMLLTVLLRPEDGLQLCCQLLDELAASGNVPVVFFRPGNNLPPDASDADVANQLSPLVKAAAQRGFAVGLYSIPDVSGVRLTPTAAAQVCEGPGGENVVAIKVTEVSYVESTARFLQTEALSKRKIVQGWDTHLASALQAGDQGSFNRCGITSGPMSFACLQYLHILERAKAKDWPEVKLAQEAVSLIFASMQDDPTKFADLQRAKYILGLGQPLTRDVTPEQIERVLKALAQVKRAEDRQRLAKSLDLLGISPFAKELQAIAKS